MHPITLLLALFWIITLVEFIVNCLHRFDGGLKAYQAPILPAVFRLVIISYLLLTVVQDNTLCLVLK